MNKQASIWNKRGVKCKNDKTKHQGLNVRTIVGLKINIELKEKL